MKRTAFVQITTGKRQASRGFALATVLIASTVMLAVLLVAVQSTAAIRTSLQGQYYNGLSRTAAESGIAFAKACLANNATQAGAPQWSSGKPLSVNTGCDGNTNSTCNASANTAACSVASNGDTVSNFSVAYPPLDSSGNATSITATGIVNVLRTSQVGTTTAPWRTYKITVTASLITPNYCSAYNPSTAGWSNVVATTEAYSFPVNTAAPITLATGNVIPGPIYYRRDFSVATAGAYNLATLADNKAEVSIDGQLVQTSLYVSGGTVNVINLSSGCHTIVVKTTNTGVTANVTKLTLAIRQVGATTDTLVSEATDTAWRVTKGNTVDFSQSNYFEDTSIWTPARVVGLYNGTTQFGAGPSGWVSATQDAYSNWISTTGSTNSGATTWPSGSYASFRTPNPIVLTTAATLKVSFACDDACTIYMDGNQIGTASGAANILTVNVAASIGSHTFGVTLYNVSAASGFIMGAIRTSDNAIMLSSDATWDSANTWSTVVSLPQSYDDMFVPSGIPATVCTVACTSITNMIVNPSFEVDASTYVGAGNGGANSAVAKTSAFAAKGISSAAVTGTSSTINDSSFNIGGDAGSGMQGMTAGHTYMLNATVKINSALTGTLDSLNRAISENLYFYSTSLGAYFFAEAKAPNVAGTYNLSLTITLPSDTTQAVLRFYNGGFTGAGTVYWDAIALYDITTSPAPTAAYYDGTSPNWTWTTASAPGLSASSGPYYP